MGTESKLIEFEDPALDNDEAIPSPHSLSVTGLSFETKREAVRTIFSKFGTIVSVRRYVPGAPRQAAVSFSTAEEMNAAIKAMDGQEIEKREVKCKVTPVVEEDEPKKKEGERERKGQREGE